MLGLWVGIWGTAEAVREWLEEHADRIDVFYLPPCSAELNPSEYFNCGLKCEIQPGVPPKDGKDLKRAMLGHSRRIQSLRLGYEPTSRIATFGL